MKAIDILQYVVMAAFAFVILAPILVVTPLGGFGSFPFFGPFDMIYVFPVLIPVMVFLLAATIIASNLASESDHAGTANVGHSVRKQSTTSPSRFDDQSYDGKDPLDILEEQYTNGTITHHEYERRLQVLLDANDSAEIRERLDWLNE